jgi:orotidine-5'-phosphate decarboxylase
VIKDTLLACSALCDTMRRSSTVAYYMSIYEKLKSAWQTQNSLLCVGLDPDFARLPDELAGADQPYFEFCRAIVDATAEHVCAFKPQAAHFAAVGRESELALVIKYVRETYPHLVVILDAKRGDIGSTAQYYAQEAYVRYGADAVTLSPYLGYESVAPYLAFADKGLIVLCRTSNADSNWLQNSPADEVPVYQRVASRVAQWNTHGQCMLVAGATYPEELGTIRRLVGEMPLLVPGIGAQGGDLAAVMANGLDTHGTGLLISSSRGILYAGEGRGYAAAAGTAARELKQSINDLR